MLKFPYAIRDFDKLIDQGAVYLDRTHFIPILENLGFELLFLRPRRFGKSLLLSMLMNYYDAAKADDFEQLFGKLAIGQNPTPLHNQYLVMRWDFSEVRLHSSIDQLEKSLNEHINQSVQSFINRYEPLLPHLHSQIAIHPENALVSFHHSVAAAQLNAYKFYLFIDEYDNFANEVMMGQQGANRKRYEDLVTGEGMFKTLFKNVKSAGSGEGLDRVFMTGVSPIVMSDVTSGANVAKNVTWHPYLNSVCGFSEEEVYELVEQVLDHCELPKAKGKEILEQMRIFYNGSRFVTRAPGKKVEDVPKIYNPTLTFYFLEDLQEFCLYPDQMLDENLVPDYNKLLYISNRTKGKQLLLDALDESQDIRVSTVSTRFGVRDLLATNQQRDRLASLLCYLGSLTIAGRSSDGKILLEIPNLVMRKLYAERILEMTFKEPAERDEAQSAADILFGQGEIQPLCAFVEKHLLSIYDNRDRRDFNELTLKTLFLALLHYNNLYIMDSEPALLRRYADLIMLIRPEMRHYDIYDILLEFKYLPLKSLIVGKRMLTGEDVKAKGHRELCELAPIKSELDQAKSQLRSYQQALKHKYGDVLKLRTYAVVGIGVDRLVWEEVSS